MVTAVRWVRVAQVWILILALWLMMSGPTPCRADDDDDDDDDDKVDDYRRPQYTVEVLTADIRGAGTNASVRIYLQDKRGRKTEGILLDNFFRTDFQRGQQDTFDLRACDTAMLRSELTVLTLERDHTGMANDWYVDHVTVTVTSGRRTPKKYTFPFNRWVLVQTKYRIPHLDTSLPADDPFPEQRQAALQHARRVYQLRDDYDQPAGIVSFPPEEDFSNEYIAFTTGAYLETAKAGAQSSCPKLTWVSLAQLGCHFTDATGIYPPPQCFDRDNWKKDEWFGAQRLAGVDPTNIRLATEIPIGLFVIEQDLLPFLEGHSLDDVIKAKRLFYTDLKVLEKYRSGFRGRVVPSPVALFYLNDQQQLVPIAIQLFQLPGPDNPVFFPSDDPYTWLLAKMWYNLAEADHHQVGSHLYRCHFTMESFSLATQRELSGSHPVFRLLKPHFQFVMRINHRARETFFGETGRLNLVLNIGSDNSLLFGPEQFITWRVDVEGTLPKALEARGVLDKSVLPDYPYRDDGLLIYNAIKDYVSDYVDLYYADDAAVTSDQELQTWAERLAAPRSDGGYGLQGMPLTQGKLASRADLVLVLTCVIFTSTAQHGALGTSQYDHYGYLPNYPPLMLGQPPTDKTPRTESDIAQQLPVGDVFLQGMSFVSVLSLRAVNPLGTPLGSWIVDPAAVQLGKQFSDKLQEIEKVLKDRDSKRKVNYPYLFPSNIPNSVAH